MVSQGVLIVDIVSAVVLSLGVVIGLTQLRQHTRQRRHDAMLDLVHSFQTLEMAQALSYVVSLRDLGVEGAVQRLEAERSPLVSYLTIAFESLGALVHREELDIELVRELFGGPVTLTWGILRPWVEASRTRLGWVRFCEWYQWLAERLEERESQARTVPAHIALRDWRPHAKG